MVENGREISKAIKNNKTKGGGGPETIDEIPLWAFEELFQDPVREGSLAGPEAKMYGIKKDRVYGALKRFLAAQEELGKALRADGGGASGQETLSVQALKSIKATNQKQIFDDELYKSLVGYLGKPSGQYDGFKRALEEKNMWPSGESS